MAEQQIWDRMKQSFEKLYHEGEKAAEGIAESLEGVGSSARAQVDKARFERQIFKRLAELGGAVYELDKSQRQTEGTAGREEPRILEDPGVRKLLDEIAAIDLKILEAQTRAKH